MGWADCGNDSKGRPIGYAFEATCDHEGCIKEIDRGLSYVCGNMHGQDEVSCEKYFCEKHKSSLVEDCQGDLLHVCKECIDLLEQSEDWEEDKEEGVFKQKVV